MTDEEAQKQEWRNAEYRRLKAEAAAMFAEVDRRRAEHQSLIENDPIAWSNVLRFQQKQRPPAPPREPDPIIIRMVEELREQLDEHRNYINGELRSLLQEVFTDISSAFDAVGDRFEAEVLVGKAIESDIIELKSENAILRADLDALKATVEALAFQVRQLADDFAAVERSGGKVVALR